MTLASFIEDPANRSKCTVFHLLTIKNVYFICFLPILCFFILNFCKQYETYGLKKSVRSVREAALHYHNPTIVNGLHIRSKILYAFIYLFIVQNLRQ